MAQPFIEPPGTGGHHRSVDVARRPEVGEEALIRFYLLHVMILPLLLAALGLFGTLTTPADSAPASPEEMARFRRIGAHVHPKGVISPAAAG